MLTNRTYRTNRTCRAGFLLLSALLLVFGCGRGNDSSGNNSADGANNNGAPHIAPRTNSRTAAANTNRNNTNGNAVGNRNTPPPVNRTPPPPAEYTLPVAFTPMAVPTPQPVADYVAGAGSAFDLTTAMLLVALEIDPQLDLAAETARINALATQLADDLGASTTLPALKEKIAFRVFAMQHLRFRQSDDDASRTDPALISLPQVLTTHEGNCVSLSLLVLAMADRLGLGNHLRAVTLPRHMFVRIAPRADKVVVFETSLPDDTVTEQQLARQAKLDWPIESRSPFGVALTRTQTLGAALNNYGMVQDAAGKPEQALDTFRLAIRLWSQNVHAHENGGGIALREASKLDAESADEAVRKRRNDLLQSAVSWLKSACAWNPQTADNWIWCAQALRLLHRDDEAIRTLDDGAPHLDNESWDVLHVRYLTEIHALHGDQALATIRKAERVLPRDDQRTQAEFHHSYALALILTGSADKAEPQLIKALDLGDSDRRRAAIGTIMQQCARTGAIAAFVHLYDVIAARAARRENDEQQFVADVGGQFATHIVQTANNQDPPKDRVDAAIRVLERSLELVDSYLSRHDLFALLWSSDQHDKALPHANRAIELADKPADKFDILMILANHYANLHENGVAGLKTVVDGLAALPEPLNREAIMYGALLIMNTPPQTRASLGKALEQFEAYIAAGGTNPNAPRMRDEIKKFLGR